MFGSLHLHNLLNDWLNDNVSVVVSIYCTGTVLCISPSFIIWCNMYLLCMDGRTYDEYNRCMYYFLYSGDACRARGVRLVM